MKFAEFKSIVLTHYRLNHRPMPWRENTDPYWILVSEMMLQQTQVSRVIPKFNEFIACFPSIQDVAEASLAEVLHLWSGLGYNRRAKYLHEAARKIILEHDGAVPNDLKDLVSLPGIGHNTAGAILVYGYDQPFVFIETNIRSVYIHHFFKDQSGVDDKDILPLIARTLPKDNPREWYWALMDYGAHLKSTMPNPSRASKHHTRQSKFEGSNRQIRGRILRELTRGPQNLPALAATINDSRFPTILKHLVDEGIVRVKNQTASI